MKNNLINDVKTTVKVFGEIRRARKRGADAVEIKMQPAKTIQVIQYGIGFLNTAEGIVLYNRSIGMYEDMYEIARDFFSKLPYEEQCRLSCIPKDGEFIERVQYWQTALKPLLSPRQYRIAITEIIQWFIHIKRIRPGHAGEVWV